MAGANTIWFKDIPAGAFPDGWRYRVETFPGGGGTLINAERLEMHDAFVESFPVIEHEGEVTPIGTFDARGVTLSVNVGAVINDELFTYLTNDGTRVGNIFPGRTFYNLKINTVWIITTDGGQAWRDPSNYNVLFIGVQRHYIGNTMKGEGLDNLTMDIELVDIGKVVMETIPVWEPGAQPWDNPNPNTDEAVGPIWDTAEREYFTLEDEVRRHVEGMGGEDAEFTVLYRNRTFDIITHVASDQDGLETVYAIMRHGVEDRESDTGLHQYVFVRWLDIVASHTSVCNRLFSAIMRQPGATTVVTSHDPSVFSGSGSVLDNVGFSQQGYTDRAEAGTALSPDALYLLAWVRAEKETNDWENQHVFAGAIAKDTALAKEYKNLWDWWRDLTECCIARGAYGFGQVDGMFTMYIQSTTLYDDTWESDPDIANRTIAGLEFKRGGEAGAIASAVANIANPATNSEASYPREVASMPQSLKHYDLRFALHSAPILPGKDDIYWVASPAPNDHEVLTQLDTDFGGVDQKIIIGSTEPNVQCFYYQATAAWITSADGSVMARVHHAVTLNLAGMVDNYGLPEGTEVLLPTVARYAWKWSDFRRSEFRGLFIEAWRTALTEIGRKSWPAQAAYVVSKILGRPEQRSTTLTVRRSDLHLENQGPLQVLQFNPRDLITGLPTNTKSNAVITSIKHDAGAGEDTVTLFNFSGDA